MHAAETVFQIGGEFAGQSLNRQAGGVGGKNGFFAQMRAYFGVEAFFDIQALGHGFDHQITIGQLGQIVVVVGRLDVAQRGFVCQRCRFLLFQRVQCFLHDGVFGAFFGRQIKQHGRHFGVGQMGGNLRPHYPCAQDGDFTYHKFFL